MNPTALVLTIISMVGIIMTFWGLRMLLVAQNPVQARLGELGARPVSLDELELQQPLGERLIRPMLVKVASFVASRTPQTQIEAIRRNLLLAGNPGNLEVSDFLGLKGSAGLLLAVLGFLIGSQMAQGITPLLIALGLGAFGFFMPDFWLSSKISGRRKEIEKGLPDALDLLTICVEAGLGFDLALYKVVQKWDNALTSEFSRAIAEMRVGKSRREALRNLVARTDSADVGNFIAAIIQADQLGVSIAKILQIQSEQMRMRRRQRAEEEAHRAPIKMLFPMIFLIFPSLFIVILGPAVPAIVEALGSQ